MSWNYIDNKRLYIQPLSHTLSRGQYFSPADLYFPSSGSLKVLSQCSQTVLHCISKIFINREHLPHFVNGLGSSGALLMCGPPRFFLEPSTVLINELATGAKRASIRDMRSLKFLYLYRNSPMTSFTTSSNYA
jgi:hypothetical protein